MEDKNKDGICHPCFAINQKNIESNRKNEKY